VSCVLFGRERSKLENGKIIPMKSIFLLISITAYILKAAKRNVNVLKWITTESFGFKICKKFKRGTIKIKQKLNRHWLNLRENIWNKISKTYQCRSKKYHLIKKKGEENQRSFLTLYLLVKVKWTILIH
jgi:hypothetical protein